MVRDQMESKQDIRFFVANNLKYLFLFILLLSITSSFISHGNSSEYSIIHPGTFFVYNVTTVQNYQGVIHVIKQVMVQKILEVYNNNTMLTNVTIYNVNVSNYFPPSISLENSSAPASVFYVNPSLLGKDVTRGGEILVYKGSEDNLYVYQNISYFDGQTWILTIWFNQYGVGVKVSSIQTSLSFTGNTTYNLWLTNYNDSNLTIPFFSGYTLVKGYSANLNTLMIDNALAKKISDGIVLIGLLAIIVILIFRK